MDRRGLVADVGRVVLATVVLGVGEAVLAVVLDPHALGGRDLLALLLVAVIVAAAIGTLLGLVLGLSIARTPKQRPTRRAALIAAVAALAAVVADLRLYVNLYPQAHALLAVAALSLTGVAALAMSGGRATRAAALGGALALVLGWPLVGALLDDRHALRHALVARSGGLGRTVAALWPAVRPRADGSCTWPPAARWPGPPPAPKAAVVLVTIDAFRADLADALPLTLAQLPDAVRFERAHAAAPRTTYSTYAMLTGRFPHRLGFVAATTDTNDRFHRLGDDDPIMLDPTKWKLRHRYPLGDATPTLAGVLGRAGWHTAAIVSDVSLLPGAGITREFGLVDAAPYHAVGRRDLGGETSETSTDAGLAFVHGLADDAPFFVWLHYRDPHHPYTAMPPVSPSASDQERHASELARVDRALARLLAGIAAHGRLRDTVVVITGDHGEEFREHGGQYHGTTLYAELVRVPLVIAYPGSTAEQLDQPVSLTDLAPTLLDLVGVESPGELDGQSFAPLLVGEPWVARPLFAFNTSYTAAGERQAAVVDGALKLVEDEGKGTLELFDELDDPGDRRNLADERPQELAVLRCLLAATGAFEDG